MVIVPDVEKYQQCFIYLK